MAAPLAAVAAEEQSSRTIILDVAQNGGLGALCAAAVIWLNNRRAPRMPPLGEEVAKTFATKDEMSKCQGACRKDIEDIRESIKENDRQAEARAKGTHSRIDQLYRESQKVNRSLGMLIGIMVGKGNAPASLVTTHEEEA